MKICLRQKRKIDNIRSIRIGWDKFCGFSAGLKRNCPIFGGYE
jgi:hypothetical protein